MSVALHSVRVTGMKGGESALVIGADMIGLLTAQAARAAGCSFRNDRRRGHDGLEDGAGGGSPETLQLSGKELIDEVLRRTGWCKSM